MRKKAIILPILALTLFSCNPSSSSSDPVTPTKFEISEFYDAIKTRNFTASDGELSQIYIGKDILKIQITNQVDTAIVRMEQGIFEIYKTESGYNQHGMVTPNKEMDITDSLFNFYRITYIQSKYWTYSEGSNSYSFNDIKNQRESLIGTGFFSSGAFDSIISITLSKKDQGYNFKVNFNKSSGFSNYTVSVTNIGLNTDKELESFIKNTTLVKQTEWNSYQLSALTTYGFLEAPFLKSYTLGLKLAFQNVYGNYMFFTYDYYSNKQKESDIALELTQLGFKDESNLTSDIKKYSKPSADEGYKLVLEFKYVPVSELEDEINKKAFPNGYLQIAHYFTVTTKEVTLDEIKLVTDAMHLAALPANEGISKIEMTDYADMMNASFYDEEYLAYFKELGVEPGPLYDEYCSIYFSISDKNEAVSYIDNYREAIRNANYEATELIDDTKSIIETASNTAAYYMFNEETDYMPMYEVYVYLNDSTSQEWSGVIEFVFIKYTELGVLFFS